MAHHHRKHRHGGRFFGWESSPRPDYCNPPFAYPPTALAPLVVPYPASVPSTYGPPAPYSYAPPIAPTSYGGGYSFDQQEQLNHALADVRRHSRNERLGEVGAAAAGAFALYERHEAKVDPAHARRHNLEAEIAGAVALGSAGYAYHEHVEKKKSEQIVQGLSSGSRHNQNYRQKNPHKALLQKHLYHLL